MTTVRTRKSADLRKAEIVDAALRLAAELGPDRLTTERLAEAVGLSQPGIFRHFPSKADIWKAVAERIAEMMRENAARQDNGDEDPAGRLHRLVTNHLAFLEATPAIPAILFSRELHAENEELRLFFAGMIAGRQRQFAKLIAAEVAAGRFSEDLNADDAAYLILALIQGLAMRWSLNARKFSLVEEGGRLLQLQLDGFTR
jgi:AcrR family transcriptional regulator